MTLRIVAAAIGPRVDAVPGWQGVAGANRITAEEITSILEKRRLRVETDGALLAATLLGDARAGRRGPIPERRVAASRAIDHQAFTDVEYPLELIATTPPLGDGLRRTRLVVDGKPRLEITTVTHGGRGRIRDVKALSGHAVGIEAP